MVWKRKAGGYVMCIMCNVIYIHSNINKVDKTECLQKVR